MDIDAHLCSSSSSRSSRQRDTVGERDREIESEWESELERCEEDVKDMEHKTNKPASYAASSLLADGRGSCTNTPAHTHAHRQMIKIYEFMRFGPELKLQALGDKLL